MPPLAKGLSLASHPWAGAALALLACLPFLPFLGMPLISDDYSQIYFARLYITPGGVEGLAADTLYRSRSTSLIATRVLDEVAGISQPAHLAFGLLLHAINVWLLFRLALTLGLDRAAALLAGFCFAFHSGHQEAVVWIASQHELLVFTFSALSVVFWLKRLSGGGTVWCAAAAACFIAALYSKESAVVVLPLLAALWWVPPAARRRSDLFWLLALLAASAAYTWAIFLAASTHLHLNDGTFSLLAPFWRTLPANLFRLLWPAGLFALLILYRWGGVNGRRLPLAIALWIALALLPYSFLTYQARIPSRHTYLAASGLAILLAAAIHALATQAPRRMSRLAPALLALFLIANLSNLWLRKLPQFERRAGATERFVSFAADHPGPIAIGNAPFPLSAYQHAVAVRFKRPVETVRYASTPAKNGEFHYSDEVHP